MPGVRIVTRPKLALSMDPSAEVAAAALQATEAGDIPAGQADILVVAVPAGVADDKLAAALEAAATEHRQALADQGAHV